MNYEISYNIHEAEKIITNKLINEILKKEMILNFDLEKTNQVNTAGVWLGSVLSASVL